MGCIAIPLVSSCYFLSGWNLRSTSPLAVILSSSFKVPCLALRVLICFKLTFLQSDREGCSLSLQKWFYAAFVEKASFFPNVYFSFPLLKFPLLISVKWLWIITIKNNATISLKYIFLQCETCESYVAFLLIINTFKIW